jgi:hypothetical protein
MAARRGINLILRFDFVEEFIFVSTLSSSVLVMSTTSNRIIILNDYAAFIMAITGPMALVVSACALLFGLIPRVRNRGGHDEVPFELSVGLFVASVILTAILFFFLSRRLARIKRIFAEGTRTKAKVVEVRFDKDRGRIEFEYPIDGQIHRTGNAIMKNKKTSSFALGDEIEVALDPENPRKALLVQLYEV